MVTMSDASRSTDESDKEYPINRNTSIENVCQELMTASSPPKFVSAEELTKVAAGLDKMALAHEIVMNPQFRLQKACADECSEAEQGSSFESTIKKIVHAAFWDSLRSDLAQAPPRYDHLLVLLAEIKQVLLSLLLPHHNKLKSEVEDGLDLHVVRQQCEKNCVDLRSLAGFILHTMAKLCAPVRDQPIQNMRACTDVLLLFKGIFDILTDMKLDMANFALRSLRPMMRQHGVEYERHKFEEYLKLNPDGLKNTSRWLKEAALKVKSASQTSGEQVPSFNGTVLKPDDVIFYAFFTLLDWSDDQFGQLPETLLVDELRLRQMRDAYLRLVLTASIVALTRSGFCGPASDAFKAELTAKLSVLMNDLRYGNGAQYLPTIAEQVCLIGKKHSGRPAVEAFKLDSLKAQICALAEPYNAVRLVFKDRVMNFMAAAYRPKGGEAPEFAAGLNVVGHQLIQLTASLFRLSSHNVQVFGERYSSILIDFSKHAQDA